MVGLIGPPPNVSEGFLFVEGISLSQEVRRAGLDAGGLEMIDEDIPWSVSSSEDARASESGVALRKPGLPFSRSMLACLPAGKPWVGCGIFEGCAALLAPVLILSENMRRSMGEAEFCGESGVFRESNR